ncbi:MAG: glycoside hydrolase family 2 protein [Cellulomonadaceae bacterium]
MTTDDTYPRPQLVRDTWVDLCGPWGFAHDDEDAGLDASWHTDDGPFTRQIQVPFPPESPASGIGDTGYHRVVWYRRELTPAELALLAPTSKRVLLHLGAVDYRARVWVDGQLVAEHEGGQTPFSADVTALVATAGPHTVVVRAEDDPLDVAQPRGKQDWQPRTHSIWYERTTGIWQPVWLEAVPELHLTRLAWTPDVVRGLVTLEVGLSRAARPGERLAVQLTHDGAELAQVDVALAGQRVTVPIALAPMGNGQGCEELLWSPEHPRLVDARVTLTSDSGERDDVGSYLGLRSAAVGGGRFLLNGHPYYVRSVLEQGYWPQSHLAAPSPDALRAEVELIKSLGFNAARIHQKVEDPRFLFWADRLGLLVWGETANAYEFSTTAVARLTREWLEILERDHSHPSIVTWVPLNESWGVQHIAHDPAQRAYATALAALTRAVDPSRPVISNDGWEHTDSDIWSIHDYTDAEQMRARYGSRERIAQVLDGTGPAGRAVFAEPRRGGDTDTPVMVTEFGGVSYASTFAGDSWGYSRAMDAEDYRERLAGVFGALQASPFLAGTCYTQLTDTDQETNGLTLPDRTPKLPVEVIRAIVRGPAASP